MVAIVDFLEDISDPTDHTLRVQFYRDPTGVLGQYPMTDADKAAIYSVKKRWILGYIARAYTASDARDAWQHLQRLNPGTLPQYQPLPDPNDLQTDPWQGQACGQEQPCPDYPVAAEERVAAFAAGAAWGAPHRSIRHVIPLQATVGVEFRLVVSGSGLFPGSLIVLETPSAPGPHWVFPSTLFCEKVFAATFVGLCLTPTAAMLDNGNAKFYQVKVRDQHGLLPDLDGDPLQVVP